MALSTRIRQYIRSNLLGFVAIFLVLGGTAYATHPGGANTISSGDIINGEVREADIRNSAVNDNKLAPNSVKTTKILNGTIGSADIGPPLSLSGSLDGNVVGVTNNAIFSGATALRGDAIRGNGVLGVTSGNGGRGVWGQSNGAFSGDGVRGSSIGQGGIGVRALASAFDGTALVADAQGDATKAADFDGTVAVDGNTDFTVEREVLSVTDQGTAADPSAIRASTSGGEGVRSESTGFGGTGVVGLATGGGQLGESTQGVVGFSSGDFGNGVSATASGLGATALEAFAIGNTNDAGFFDGNVAINGTLSKTAGSFRIDHPLDPAGKYLQHSFVESPDMKNIYDGVVTTDDRGFATVEMPEWFSALNRSFRYQLTVHGRSFARAIVWRELDDNRFTIRTDEPQTKVSWQVTGIRKDAYANANRIKAVVPKKGSEDGRYLYPELFGEPASRGIAAQWRGR